MVQRARSRVCKNSRYHPVYEPWPLPTSGTLPLPDSLVTFTSLLSHPEQYPLLRPLLKYTDQTNVK